MSLNVFEMLRTFSLFSDPGFLEGGWLFEPDENWAGLDLRENFMHLWIRTWT